MALMDDTIQHRFLSHHERDSYAQNACKPDLECVTWDNPLTLLRCSKY